MTRLPFMIQRFSFINFGGFLESTQINSPSFEMINIPLPSNRGSFIPKSD